jgi:hypothetical protein
MKILPPFINNKIHHALPILEKRNILTIFGVLQSTYIPWKLNLINKTGQIYKNMSKCPFCDGLSCKK